MSKASNLAGFAASISSNNNLNVGVVTASSFVGNVTGNSTGLSGTPNITIGNITGVAATFTGNVSIAGTLTYEDVTNVDSVGLVTARAGAHVATSSGNLLVGTTSATGTASQPLQVTGGGYVSGNLGIGRTNPGAKLDVAGDIRLSAGDPEIELNSGGPRIKVPSANTLTIHSGGGLNSTSDEIVRIITTGVGIGTTNPQEALHVVGVVTATSYRGDGSQLTGVSVGTDITSCLFN